MAALHKYPHLLPADIPVWERFLSKHNSVFDAIDYDVRVGAGRPREDLPTEQLRRMATDLSKRRIDAVCHLSGLILIIEITHSLGFTALGQLQSYPILYRRTYPGTYILRSMIVAGEIQTDIHTVLHGERIPHWTPQEGITFSPHPKLK